MYNLHDCCLLLAKFMQTSFEIQSNTPHADFCSAGVLRKERENITKNYSLLPSDFSVFLTELKFYNTLILTKFEKSYVLCNLCIFL